MKTVWLVALTLVQLSSCRTPGKSTTENFFENSKRRPSTLAEAAFVAELSRPELCTAYWVKNDAGESLLISATHCMNFNPAAWCARRPTVLSGDTGESYACSEIIAGGDGSHDTVMFAVDGSHDGPSLSLLSGPLPAKTRLTMVGFPTDFFAGGVMQTTEDCWVLSETVDNPYIGTSAYDSGAKDEAFSHNCSTYAGNSGGPMIIEGTTTVAGSPFTYRQDLQQNSFDSNLAAGAKISDFVHTYATILKEHKVSIVATAVVNAAPTNPYLRAADFRSTDGPCVLTVVPLYLTQATLSQLKVKSSCTKVDADYTLYTCTNGTCTSPSAATITTITDSGFIYQEPNGKPLTYKEP